MMFCVTHPPGRSPLSATPALFLPHLPLTLSQFALATPSRNPFTWNTSKGAAQLLGSVDILGTGFFARGRQGTAVGVFR